MSPVFLQCGQIFIIVINSFNGIGGKPEAVEIKDGSAELKAAEEKAKLDKAHEEAKDGSAEPQEPEETAKQEAKSAEEDKTPVKPEKIVTACLLSSVYQIICGTVMTL